jgi:hypothetical protein
MFKGWGAFLYVRQTERESKAPLSTLLNHIGGYPYILAVNFAISLVICLYHFK